MYADSQSPIGNTGNKGGLPNLPDPGLGPLAWGGPQMMPFVNFQNNVNATKAKQDKNKGLGTSTSGGSPEEDDILAKLQEFYDHFNAPLDYNDPFVASILNNAQASTTQRAGNAGIYGPYSQNLAQQAYIKSAAGLQQAKQQMAGNALGMLTSYKTNKRDFDYNKAKDQYQADLDLWKMQGDKNQDFWRGIGGGLGAIGGGILGIPGGPAGIIAGASGGFGLGQEVGGGAYQAFGGQGNSAPRWSNYKPLGT